MRSLSIVVASSNIFCYLLFFFQFVDSHCWAGHRRPLGSHIYIWLLQTKKLKNDIYIKMRKFLEPLSHHEHGTKYWFFVCLFFCRWRRISLQPFRPIHIVFTLCSFFYIVCVGLELWTYAVVKAGGGGESDTKHPGHLSSCVVQLCQGSLQIDPAHHLLSLSSLSLARRHPRCG